MRNRRNRELRISRAVPFFTKSNLLTNVSIGDRLNMSIYSRQTYMLHNVESNLM